MITSSIDPDRLFADAQRAFAAGDGTAALALLDRLPPAFAVHPDILHLRALALKASGRFDEAKASFAAAQRADPHNPQILNNYANLVLQGDDAAAALPLYEAALARQPDYHDAAYNRALCLQSLGRLTEALTAVDSLLAGRRDDARLHSARGTILLALERHDEAACAFDTALAPGRPLPKALSGRARVALERGEPDASARYKQALALCGNDPELLLGLADALEAEGDPAGIAVLADAVASRPDWIAGHERLAQMRAEAGDGGFTSHYNAALDDGADRHALHLSLARTLAAADQYDAALAALGSLDDRERHRVLRAHYLGEAGRPFDGLTMLAGLRGPDAGLLEGRLAMATGDLDRAAVALARAVAEAPTSISIWAHLELLWRVTGDDRAVWLSGQDNLVAVRAIGLSGAELADLAALLRTLHRTRAYPIGQSLRGGTQTRGRLLLHQEPEIRRLRAALEAAVADQVRALPPADPTHPLLRHRHAPLRIAGSWSVRLTSQGFHVSHIHPEGLLSSACYIALPDNVAEDPARSGWLEIGRPPATLNLSLEPLTMIMPAAGRLALFPSYLFHGTRPFRSGERMTVAFDVVSA